MAISSVLLIAVGTTFATSLRLTSGVNARTSATVDAKLAMDTAARRLRVAVRPDEVGTMIVTATDSTVTFYASIAPPDSTSAVLPTKVEYAVDPTSGCFRESLTPATSTPSGSGATLSWPVSMRTTRCLVFGRVNSGGSPLFTYFTKADETVALPRTSGSLPATSLDLVRSVAINMNVRDTPGSTAIPTQVQTRVGLVNRIAEDLNGRRS